MSIFLRILGVTAAVALIVIFGIIPFSMNVINIGNIAGIAAAVWLLFLSLKPSGWCLSGVPKVLFRTANGIFIAFLVYGLIITITMMTTSAIKPAENATVVLLGAQVRPTGEPSSILSGRIKVAEKYLKENPEAKAVLSGGKGSDEIMSEAQCMYNVLTADGISPDRLYLEEQSTNTTENFRNSMKIIEENGLNPNLAVATDRFHQARVRMILWQQGITSDVGALSANTRWDLVPTYVVREWFALPHQLLFR